MDIDAANNARDRRLRKRLLLALHRSRPVGTGWINGRLLLDSVAGGPAALAVQDDDHAAGLLGYLADSGYVEQRDERTHKSQRRPTPDLTSYRVTPKGSQLVLEVAPVDPLVDDARRDGTERE